MTIKLNEVAPPGREKQVLELKKKFPKGSSSPFKIAWASYNKKKPLREIVEADIMTTGISLLGMLAPRKGSPAPVPKINQQKQKTLGIGATKGYR